MTSALCVGVIHATLEPDFPTHHKGAILNTDEVEESVWNFRDVWYSVQYRCSFSGKVASVAVVATAVRQTLHQVSLADHLRKQDPETQLSRPNLSPVE